MNTIKEIAQNAKQASISALQLSSEIKNHALSIMAKALKDNQNLIISANKKDLENAKTLLQSGKMSDSMFNRLKLDENKLRDMIQGVIDISLLDDPVNKVLWSKDIADGINLQKVSCPIGVIGVIFESRPDVISQICALSVKSSNAVILKGGSEAAYTNKQIFSIIADSLKSVDGFPDNIINLIFSREDVTELLDLDEYINLIIPRGSNALVKHIKANTKIPVLAHADGICHIFIDESADIHKAIDICIDSKCQYPAACNSVETILLHRKLNDDFLKKLLVELNKNNVTIYSDTELFKRFPEFITGETTNWHYEYGEKALSLKIVNSEEDAIEHINTYGSGHTDCIITENKENANKFMMFVDSAGVYSNISTRFADGFRYGFGAEVGISTNKTHARGPVGLEGLTIYKYKLSGNGDIVNDFVLGKRKFISLI